MATLDEQLLAHQEEQARKRSLEHRRAQARQAVKGLGQSFKKGATSQVKKLAAKTALRAVLAWLAPVLGFALLGVFIVLFIIMTITVMCGNFTGSLAVQGAGAVLGAGNLCQTFQGMQGFANFIDRSNVVRNPSQGADVSKWLQQINDAARDNGLDPCYLRSFVEKESAGDDKAIGHNHTAPPPPVKRWQGPADGDKAYEPSHAHDPFNKDAPTKYGLDWNFSHDIGLMQINVSQYNSDWVDANTPARILPGSSRKLTVTELLDAETSIDAAAGYLHYLVLQFNGDYQRAAAAYNGSGPQADQYAQDIMARASVCKRA